MGAEYIVQFPKLGWEFSINTDVFSIGSFSIKWYGALIGIGFLLAVLYGFKNAKKMAIKEDPLFDAVIWGLIGGIFGARAYYIIFYPGNYFTEPTFFGNFLRFFQIYLGGLGFYGGLIGAIVIAGIVAKRKKINIPALFDITAIGFLIGQSIGRWGNFVNQEAFGVQTDLPWGMASVNTGFLPVHPCFLYESILCAIGFVALHFFNKKYRRYDGQIFLLYLVWYGIIRFFIESLRTDSLMIGPIRVSMAVAALTVLAAAACLVKLRKSTKLTGIGDPQVMEMNGITLKALLSADSTDEDEKESGETEKVKSTIFTEDEEETIYGAEDDAEETESTDTAESEDDANETADCDDENET
jgi:prolipoprotein diacylglyceryl transferase